MSSQLRDQRGFVLVVVLWIIAILAIVAAAFSRSVQGYVREASSSARTADAQMMADAGANLVAYLFTANRGRPDLQRRFGVDGRIFACRFAELGTLQIAVQDAGGKVNVNLADPRLLAALMSGLGVPVEAAVRHADRIVDFRDPDDETNPSGAERQAYLDALAPRGPKNAPFESLLELHQVLGLDAATVATISPYLTLNSGSAKLDPAVTPAALTVILNKGLRLLPFAKGFSILEDRVPEEFSGTAQGRHYWVSITARPDAGGAFVREATIDLQSPDNPRPRFIGWDIGTDTGPSTDAVETPPPC